MVPSRPDTPTQISRTSNDTESGEVFWTVPECPYFYYLADAFTEPSAYITFAESDTDRPDLFEPAPYLLTNNQIRPKCLFRIRTQRTKEIPTHNQLRQINGRLAHSTYSDRICPFCYSTSVTGNEIH